MSTLSWKAETATVPSPSRKSPEENQDFCASDPERGIFVLCDGAGGHAAGKAAAQLAGQKVLESLKSLSPSEAPHDPLEAQKQLRDAIVAANTAVFESGAQDPQGSRRCSTITVLWVRPPYAIFGHVGDSRIYHVRGPEVSALTLDHRYEQLAILEGFTPEAAKRLPDANRLYQAVGILNTVRPSISLVELLPGDRLVLCSDGVHKTLAEEELRRAFTASGPLDRLSAELLRLAGTRGARDDVSAVFVEIGKPKTPPESPSQSIHRTEILKNTSLFAKLDSREIQSLLAIAKEARFAPETTLMTEGEDAKDFWVMLSGKISVQKRSSAGKNVELSVRSGVITLGERSFFSDKSSNKRKRSATLVARSEVRALIFERDPLFELFSTDTRLGLKIAFGVITVLLHERDSLSQRVADTDEGPG